MDDIQRLGLVFVSAPVVVFAAAMLLVRLGVCVRRMWRHAKG